MFHSCCMPPILCVYPIDGPLWRRRAYTRHSNVPTLNVSCMPGFDVDFISYETKKKREKKKFVRLDWCGMLFCRFIRDGGAFFHRNVYYTLLYTIQHVLEHTFYLWAHKYIARLCPVSGTVWPFLHIARVLSTNHACSRMIISGYGNCIQMYVLWMVQSHVKTTA